MNDLLSLPKVKKVIAVDISPFELDRLVQNVSLSFRSKLHTEVCDVTKFFPFEN